MTNPYCEQLGIQVPRLEAVRNHPQATTFALLIVALLERGGPMTLRAVADRFEAAGIAPAEDALAALQRCRPARPPVWRDGDQYDSMHTIPILTCVSSCSDCDRRGWPGQPRRDRNQLSFPGPMSA